MSVSAEALRVKEKYADYLLKLEGVTGVGVNGSVIIYVKELTPKLSSFLPKDLEGIPVRIVRTGTIVPLGLIPPAFAIYAERTGRYRPAPGGCSCGHPQITAGTLSCRAIDKQTKEIVGLSNAHVISLNWGLARIGVVGDSILQPGPYDGGVDPVDKIGELLRWVTVEPSPAENLIDGAAFRSSMLTSDILELGRPDTLSDPAVGMNVVKSGRTSGVNFGKIIDVNATMIVEGPADWGTCTFVDQVIVQPAFLSPGDSGSWVGEVDTLRTVGLGHAGSPDVSIVCKGTHVEELLQVEIIPPTGYIPWYAMAGVWGGVFGVGSVALGRVKPRGGEGCVI